MIKLLARAFGHLAAFASILGVYLTLAPPADGRPLWHWLVITTASVFTLGFVVWELRENWRALPKKYKNQSDINNYMHRWIKGGGRAVIFSRDMSWADNEQTLSVLLSKARNRELTLCIQHEMPLGEQLRAAGAQIIVYGDLNHTPRSRFTIVDYEKEGARVAVGAHLNGRHMIEEFRSGAHPLFAVAEDLIKILERATEQARQ